MITDLGLKPKLAFGPVRAAVTGRRISPPLFESLELLGRDSALHPDRGGPSGRWDRLRWPTGKPATGALAAADPPGQSAAPPARAGASRRPSAGRPTSVS